MLCGLQNILRLRNHNKNGYSFELILLSLIHLKTKSLKLTQKERQKLNYLTSKQYQFRRGILVQNMQHLIVQIRDLDDDVHGGLINLNELARTVNAHKMDIDFELYFHLNKKLTQYQHLMNFSYLRCNRMEKLIGDEFCKI